MFGRSVILEKSGVVGVHFEAKSVCLGTGGVVANEGSGETFVKGEEKDEGEVGEEDEGEEGSALC